MTSRNSASFLASPCFCFLLQMLQGTDSDGKSWVYEGSIMSGQKHGFGKLTFSNLGLVYEGEFYKGRISSCSLELREFAHADSPADKYHGWGKLTCSAKNYIYEGEIDQGRFSGCRLEL